MIIGSSIRGLQKHRLLSITPAAILIAVVAMITTISGCGRLRETRVVRVGILKSDIHQLAYYVARDKGFFTDKGLDVREGGVFNSGVEEMSSFSAGELDMGYVGIAPALTFTAQGTVDIKIAAQLNEGASAIVVRAGLEADDIAALRGRIVATPGFSTLPDMVLRTALDRVRLNEADVEIVTVNPPEMIQALSSARVDAFAAEEPYVSQAVEQNVGRALTGSSKVLPHHPCCVLVVDAEFARRNPDTVKRFVAAHVLATKFIKDNMLETSDMAGLITEMDGKVISRAMKNMGFAYQPDIKTTEQYVGFLESRGVIKVKDPASFTRGLFDERFLPKD